MRTNSPAGAYYLLVDCSAIAETGTAAADHLLHERLVVTIPGEAFHAHRPARPYVRACFAAEDHEIEHLRARTRP